MDLELSGEVVEWRGPAPYHFVVVPPEQCELIADLAGAVTYGWGMIPVRIRVGETTSTTSLWPRDGGYVAPLKDALRKPEGIGLGDVVTVHLQIDV